MLGFSRGNTQQPVIYCSMTGLNVRIWVIIGVEDRGWWKMMMRISKEGTGSDAKTADLLPGVTGRLLPVCVCCRGTPVGGIRDGILLSGRFLCSDCEREITSLTVVDTRYNYYRERIKEFLFGYLQETGSCLR